MTHPLLTISEASEKTGRSFSTIRRLIRTITDETNHADRAGVEPTPAQVTAFKKKGENFTWKIREDIVLKHLGTAQVKEKKTGDGDQDGIMDILRHELELKNSQIEKQWEVIHALNDRLREGNILMGSLQQRLALPVAEGATTPAEEAHAEAPSAEATQKSSPAPSKKAKAKVATTAATPAAPGRRGILRWFGR